MQVLEARIDHSRVVSILRKADHLPLVKDYLIAVQKGNLAAVNDAVNELLCSLAKSPSLISQECINLVRA